MADKTKIEWTDATWNPITGCSVVSPGCTNCYAMKLAGTRLKHHPSRADLTRDTKAGPVWTGEVRLNEDWLDQPLRWKAPRMIFVCAHGDLFAEGVPDEWIDRVFAVMALTPQHTFQVLTKRAERMRDYLRDERTPGRIARTILDMWLAGEKHARATMAGDRWPVRSIGDIDDPDDVTIDLPLSNVWLGVSAEDQKRADERVPLLLDTPAAVRWVSAEPLLGPIDFTRIEHDRDSGWEDAMNALRAYPLSEAQEDWGENCDQTADRPRLDWIVAGGESGNDARPMHPDWVRSIRDQCAAADVPFLFKQWGAWAPVVAEAGEDGELDAVPALPGCSDPSVHRADQECRFWQADGLVHWPLLETLPAIGARLVGKKAAGRRLDGVTHDAFPSPDEVPFS